MIEKVEKLLDLAAEALTLYIRKTQSEFGEALPFEQPAVAAKPPRAAARKPKEAKKSAAAAFEPVEPAPAPVPERETSPFGDLTHETAVAAATVEEQLEAKRRVQEVMGLFIRRHLKAVPPGLERAKEILNATTGREIAKLEDLTHADNLKLIPIFEAALEEKVLA